MNGTPISYLWSDGSYEKYNLRKVVLESAEKLAAPAGNFY